MFGICTLFCLILVNVISGTNGVGEEADNGNGKKDLFGEMWRKAFEANRHNGKEREEKEEMPKKKVKKEEQTEEEMEKEGVAEESTKRVKEEQKEEGGNKLWKKVKREPIDDQMKEEEEEERDGKKWQKRIKKEPKIEENELEDLRKTEKENNQQQEDGSASDQLDSDQSTADGKKIECESKKVQKKELESEEKKSEIIEKFEKMRNEYKIKRENRTKIEEKIAKELGTYRDKIYEWKKELNQKKPKSEKEKWEIIERFDKMRNESKMKGDYKRSDRAKIEQEIAKALGISRKNIYEWKKQLNRKKESEINRKKESESEERKREIIEKFDKMKNENKNENGNRAKFEHKIAKELGTYRDKIYKWKKELRGPENEEEKREIIERFDKIRKEYKMKGNVKREDWNKIEEEIAKKLGTTRKNIYKLKKQLNRKKESESEERKREIIEKFEKMRNESKMKGDYKSEDRYKIEQEIAKQLGAYRDKIFEWKREFAKSKPRDKYTNEQKGQIIELFDKLCEEFANKFNRKAGTQIKEKIARKFGVTRRTIDRWKKNEH